MASSDHVPLYPELVANGNTGDAMTEYLRLVRVALDGVDVAAMERFVAFLRSVHVSSGTVHVAGDGGSAALAQHLACDFSKLRTLGKGPEVRSLVENPALLTMLANDHGFDEVFARQVAISIRGSDGLLLISGSGRSPNLLRAAATARERGIRTFALLGFGDGGPLAALVDDAAVVASGDYRIIEDVHHSIGHAAAAALSEGPGDRSARVAVFPRDVLLSAEPTLLGGAPPWRPGAQEALGALRTAGWTIVMIDEDPPGDAIFAADELVDLAVACTHGTTARCQCRRPGTGLLDRAAQGLGLRPDGCVVIGNAPADVVLGQRAGSRTILIGVDPPTSGERAADLAGAVSLLLRER